MKDRKFGTILQIEPCLISEDVIFEYFCCDYAACRGACCIEGDSGAPLREEELEPLERNYPFYEDLMSEKGKEAVREKGFFDIDRDGDIVTPLCKGTEECAYCSFDEGGGCYCCIERRFTQGKGDWQKPISCSLYPIRITALAPGQYALNLHRWDICAPAYEKGRKEGIRVYEFLREPLTRLFGEEFYSALSFAARSLIASS